MKLILRGHIRNSFNTPHLKQMIHDIYKLDPTLEIYIHTWNIYTSRISWRPIYENPTPVNRESIYHYFGELSDLIQEILIDDDSTISLIGKTEGKLCKSKMPVRGWKNYWYGKYRIIDSLYHKNISPTELIINTRFDVLSNSHSCSIGRIFDFIQSQKNKRFTKNVFMYEKMRTGIDNLYVGNIHTMHKLATQFYYHLDEIEKQYPKTTSQEYLVFFVNQTIPFLSFKRLFLILVFIVVSMGFMYVFSRYTPTL